MNAVLYAPSRPNHCPLRARSTSSDSLHPCVRVPMREISLQPAAQEPPLSVYDSSGPYTDPARANRHRARPAASARGLDPARADTETYAAAPCSRSTMG